MGTRECKLHYSSQTLRPHAQQPHGRTISLSHAQWTQEPDGYLIQHTALFACIT